nr:MAG TPA: hypothetical protein [Caudoviricetes sp.]
MPKLRILVLLVLPVRAVPLSLASTILALPLQKILLTSLPLLIRI